MKALNLVFAGGGTGGHIYPALAIAEWAAQLDGRVRTHVLCSTRGVDAEILRGEGVEFTALPAQPPVARAGPMLRFARAWLPSVSRARLVLEDCLAEGPAVLVAMGGFVCPPAVSGAIKEGVPVVLVNLDAVPGKANRWVGERAERCFTAAEVPQNWTFVGPIVRPGLIEPIDAGAARARFGLDPAVRTLLVTGGSQGARSINGLMERLAVAHPGAFAGWQVIHQTGSQHAPGAVRAAYTRAGVRSWVDHYLTDMPGAWAAASLSIGRCGAGTVGEAWATRTPAVFFPYPYHADQHQKRNAQPLVRAGSAVVFDDLVDAERNAAEYGGVIMGLLTDPERLGALAEPAARLGPADGASRIAQALLGMMDRGRAFRPG